MSGLSVVGPVVTRYHDMPVDQKDRLIEWKANDPRLVYHGMIKDDRSRNAEPPRCEDRKKP